MMMNIKGRNKLYIAIACVSVVLVLYDFWMSVQMAEMRGIAEIFGDISILSGKIYDIQLPFYAFWITAIWASFRRWLPFFVLLLLLSPFIFYSGISNFVLLHVLLTQPMIPVHLSTILFLSISGGFKILLVLLVLLLIITEFRKRTKATLPQPGNNLFIWMGGLGIALSVVQLLNCIIVAQGMSYSLWEVAEYCVVAPSLLLWLMVIWAGFKRWRPILGLLLLLSPLLIAIGLIGVFGFEDSTTFLVKILGCLQIVLVGFTIYGFWKFARE